VVQDFSRPIDLNNLPASVLYASRRDPAESWPGAPPLFGQDVVPHFFTSTGYVGSAARAYPIEDEATRNSAENAVRMRTESGIMECLEARQRATALLKWHLVPENEQSAKQQQLCQVLSRIIERTPRFVEYRRCLLEALWYGRYAVANRFGVEKVGGKYRTLIKDWGPRNGDKLVFRYNDNTYRYVEGQAGIRVHANFAWQNIPKLANLKESVRRQKIEPTQYGLVYWFDQYERETMVIHKHMVEDGPWEQPSMMGRVMGVGIRDRIFWTWYAMQALLQDLLTYVNRAALGVRLWRYPSGNQQWKEHIENAAKNAIANGVADILFPVEPNEFASLYGVEQIEPGIGGAQMIRELIEGFFLRKIKKYILGQLLTSEAEATGLGSGVAEAHLATFSDIIRYDASNLQETLTEQLVRKLQKENAPKSLGVYVRLLLDTDSPDTEKRLAAIQAAYQMDVPIKVEDVYQLTGLSKPEPNDHIISVSIQQEKQQKQQQNMMMQQQAQMMAMQQQAGAEQGAPPPGAEAAQGQPEQKTLDVSPENVEGTVGATTSGTQDVGADAGAIVEKTAMDEPGPQQANGNPWSGFWESFFNAARGVAQDAPPPEPDYEVQHQQTVQLPPPDQELVDQFADIMDEYMDRERTLAEFQEDVQKALNKQELVKDLSGAMNVHGLAHCLSKAFDRHQLAQRLGELLEARIAEEQEPILDEQQKADLGEMLDHAAQGEVVPDIQAKARQELLDALNKRFGYATAEKYARGWAPYHGPRQGKGWRNILTGEVRYQSSMPTDSGGAGSGNGSGGGAGREEMSGIGNGRVRHEDTRGWVGFVLDGTLAEVGTREQIGDPVPKMVHFARELLHEGRDVRIFTPRVTMQGNEARRQRRKVRRWAEDNLGQIVPIVHKPDRHMAKLFDEQERAGDDEQMAEKDEYAMSVRPNLFQIPEWAEPHKAKLLAAIDTHPAKATVDFHNEWQSLSPAQRQELVARGWKVTPDRLSKVLLGVSQQAKSEAMYDKVNRARAAKALQHPNELGNPMAEKDEYGILQNAVLGGAMALSTIGAPTEAQGGSPVYRKFTPIAPSRLVDSVSSTPTPRASSSLQPRGPRPESEPPADLGAPAKTRQGQSIPEFMQTEAGHQWMKTPTGYVGGKMVPAGQSLDEIRAELAAADAKKGPQWVQTPTGMVRKDIKPGPKPDAAPLVVKQDEVIEQEAPDVAGPQSPRAKQSKPVDQGHMDRMRQLGMLPSEDITPEQARETLAHPHGRTLSETEKRMLQRTAAQKFSMTAAEIDEAVQSWSPPTEGQIEAGNYRKPRIRLHGFEIAIENPKGTRRRPEWPELANHYGYLSRISNQSAPDVRDGDKLDVFLGDHPESEIVFVIDQETESGRFDEHKAIFAARNAQEARETYLANYPSDWRCGPVTALTAAQFRAFLEHGDTTKRIAEQVSKYMAAWAAEPERYVQPEWMRQNAAETQRVQNIQHINESLQAGRAPSPSVLHDQILHHVTGGNPSAYKRPTAHGWNWTDEGLASALGIGVQHIPTLHKLGAIVKTPDGYDLPPPAKSAQYQLDDGIDEDESEPDQYAAAENATPAPLTDIQAMRGNPQHPINVHRSLLAPGPHPNAFHPEHAELTIPQIAPQHFAKLSADQHDQMADWHSALSKHFRSQGNRAMEIGHRMLGKGHFDYARQLNNPEIDDFCQPGTPDKYARKLKSSPGQTAFNFDNPQPRTSPEQNIKHPHIPAGSTTGGEFAPKGQTADILPGGKADDVPDSAVPAQSLQQGIEHEAEHTSSPQVAKEIAKDHIVGEGGDYYKKLDEMEQGGGEQPQAQPQHLYKFRGQQAVQWYSTETGRKMKVQPRPVEYKVMASSPQEAIAKLNEMAESGVTKDQKRDPVKLTGKVTQVGRKPGRTISEILAEFDIDNPPQTEQAAAAEQPEGSAGGVKPEDRIRQINAEYAQRSKAAEGHTQQRKAFNGEYTKFVDGRRVYNRDMAVSFDFERGGHHYFVKDPLTGKFSDESYPTEEAYQKAEEAIRNADTELHRQYRENDYAMRALVQEQGAIEDGLRDAPKQRTIDGGTEPAKPKPATFEDTGGEQQSLFAKGGAPGQMNLFADKGVPDDMVQGGGKVEGDGAGTSNDPTPSQETTYRWLAREVAAAVGSNWADSPKHWIEKAKKLIAASPSTPKQARDALNNFEWMNAEPLSRQDEDRYNTVLKLLAGRHFVDEPTKPGGKQQPPQPERHTLQHLHDFAAGMFTAYYGETV
jgi:phage gp29-like protein